MFGTRAVRDVLLDRPETRNLQVSIAWVPMLDDDELAGSVRESAQFAERNVAQYWDGKQRLGDAVRSSTGLPESSAWGTYLFYRGGSEWPEQGAPRPDIVIKEAYGVIVANRGALPRLDDESALPGGFASCCEAVGRPASLPTLLHDAAVRSIVGSPPQH